jgi:hypothetical protein
LPAADRPYVIHRLLVLTAYICCGLVIASFSLFARDQIAGASKHQQSEIVAGAQTTTGPVPVSTHHGQPRAFIDGAASALTAPFRALVNSHSQWVLHIVPLLFALLVYGVGLGYLARFSSGYS